MRRIHAVVIGLALMFVFALSASIYAAAVGTSSTNSLPPVSSFTYSPAAPMPGDVITFNASASYDPDGYIVQYKWDFGDGDVATTTSPTPTHSYPVDADYTVELVVTDNSGATGASSAIVQVSTVVFFRTVFTGTLAPVANVQVTLYYFNGSSWTKAPVGSSKSEIKYDNLTQPNLASTSAERYRNPGFTASILRQDASNIGFDIHPSSWKVYFKFQWGPYTAYWPNETTRVYTYKDGTVETHDYQSGHKAYWDAAAGTYVINVNDIPGNGVSPTESHPIIVGILCPPPTQKYYLTVKTDPLGITTIPGQGLYDKDTNVTLTAPATVAVSSNTQYRFNYWDVDGTSRGAGVNPITVQMNANHTATAHYILQYSVSFAQTGLSLDTTGTVVTVDGVTKLLTEMPFTKWVDNGSSITYSYNSIVTSSTVGKRYRLNSVTGPTSPITVTGPVSVTGNFVTQYMVTFAQTGLDSSATGTVVTVNGTAKTYTDLPFNWWVDSGSTVTYNYSSIVSSSVTGKQFRLTGVNCPPSQFIVTAPVTITGTYCVQYKVTFNQAGLDSSATGTVVTVNGTAKTYGVLPYSLWVDSGSSLTYSYTSTVASSVSGKQFRLTGVTGPTSPITATGPVTVTGNYVTQYLVTFGQSGLDSTATGTVVTVNGSPKIYGNLPYSLWVDSGSSVTYSYASPVASSTSGKQFRMTGVSGPGSPITVTGPVTVTGSYVVQYLVTFAQSGLDSTATGTVVTVDSAAKAYTDLPYGLWVDSGSSVTYAYSSPVASSASGKQFRLTGVTGPTSPITVTNSATVTGNYAIQYQVSFTHSGLDSSATGTVVTVNSVAKTYSDLPYSVWVDSGSSVTYSYNDVLSTVSGKRFKLTGVSGPTSPITVTASVTVTGNYKTQYQVTFDQSGVGTDFTGTIVTIDSTTYNGASLPTSFWWDQSSSHSFSFSSPLTVNASKQYIWSSTSGLSTLQSGTLTVTTSGSVLGNYVVQNSVTFDQVGASPDFTGTIVTIDGTPYNVSQLPKSFSWQLGTIHSFAFQSPLIVTANSKQYVWTNTAGLSALQSGSLNVTTFGSIIGNYKTQYYLTATSAFGTPGGQGWYDSGVTAYATLDTGIVDYGNGTRRVFTNWSTDATGTNYVQSDPIIMNGPKTALASWKAQYTAAFAQSGLDSSASSTVVTVNGNPKAYGNLPYSLWVDSGSSVTYAYSSPVASSTPGKQFRLTGVSGPGSPITMTGPATVTGNYVVQYSVTFAQSGLDSTATGTVVTANSTAKAYTDLPYGVWVDSGSSVTYTYGSPVASSTPGKQFRLTGVTGSSSPITVAGPTTVTGNYVVQYQVSFTHSGLDSSASGTVVTVNGNAKSYGDLPYSLWVDNGNSATYSYGNVSSSTAGKRFILDSVSGPSSPITVTSPLTITGNYVIQYQVTFNQSGLSNDFGGTVVTVDGNTYTYSTLPSSFWWDSGSAHTFSFASPLIVNASKQYNWVTSTGLSTLQSDTLTITSSGSVTGNYNAQYKYQVTFDQTGLSSDFTAIMLVVDGTNYGVTSLPVSFWFDSGSTHSFSYLSPLVVNASAKQYTWTNTSGLSSAQSETIIVTGSGSVTGNYKTQYYLTLATNPQGVTIPSGAGWYDAGTNATVSTQAFVDITLGSSRYRFSGWTTQDMSEISNPLASPTTVRVDKAKTVTADYTVQLRVTFDQSGAGSDFTGTVVTVDGTNYAVTTLPVSFWYDNSTTHTFAYQSPLVVTPNAKQYAWTSTTGLSTLQSGTLSISSAGSLTGNYKTQYYLTVTSAYGSPSPTSGWYDTGSSITASIGSPVSGPSGTRYVCTGWSGTGSVPASGSGTSTSFTITQASTLTWNWKTQYYLTVKTDPLGLVTIPGEGWYDASASVLLSAPPVANYNFTNWDVDGTSQGSNVNPITVTMNGAHTATAHYQQISINPLTVSINPLSATVFVTQSVIFDSTTQGGSLPYSYQWYVNDHPIPGATAWNWTFTPSASGIYYIYLRVTDASNTTAQSATARIDVVSTPVGGYSISKEKPMPFVSIAAYIALAGIFSAAISLAKRKRK